MKLTNQQTELALHVWSNYVANGEEHLLNASKEYTQQELDRRRRETIPEVAGWIIRFLQGDVPLEEFKTGIDGINKRNRLWGFQGINGQMFFNMLTKNSVAGNRHGEFVSLLKCVLPVPSSIEKAKALIEKFSEFTRDLGKYCQDMRAAPKVGSVPLFLSYFWQIQAPDIYPMYYSSMVNAFRDLGIWSPTGIVSDDYVAFYQLNYALRDFLSEKTGKKLHLWDVEHAFWFHMQPTGDQKEQVVQPKSTPPIHPLKDKVEDLPESYIPPVVSILPLLAQNDENMNKACQKTDKKIEKVFEERLAVLFGMLGYQTELKGQGHGRVPDGVAISEEFRYAIVYDAKVRQQAYTMGIDERAIREYIASQSERLRRRGIRSIYFMVISSAFTGDHDDVIRGMKIETGVNEVLLVDVKALLAMLEGKLRNPDISLGPDGIQRLLASSGILTESDAREFMEI